MAELWVWLQARAAAALRRGARRRAGLWFRLAWLVALGFRRGDPRHAVGLALLALADRRAGRRARAERRLARALALWPDVTARLAAEPAAPRARSSVFHLRMEARHRAAYEARARGEVMDLAQAMERAMRSGSPLPPPAACGPLADACRALSAVLSAEAA